MVQFIKMKKSERLWVSLTVTEMLNHTQAFREGDTVHSVENYAATFKRLSSAADLKDP